MPRLQIWEDAEDGELLAILDVVEIGSTNDDGPPQITIVGNVVDYYYDQFEKITEGVSLESE
jgi:hypothetical protein